MINDNYLNYPELDKNNKDYHIEFFWYGFKNLLINYFKKLNLNSIITYTSIELNKLQKDNNFNEIYQKIYSFIEIVINIIVEDFNKYSIFHDNGYIFTWIKRYNKIDNTIKFELSNLYTNIPIKDISSKDSLLIKFEIIHLLFKKKIKKNLCKVFTNCIYTYLDHCVNNKLYGLFDLISLHYNIDLYYDIINIKPKTSQVSLRKILLLTQTKKK